MHACMYVGMHVCMYVCMFVCTYVRTYCMYVYIFLFINVTTWIKLKLYMSQHGINIHKLDARDAVVVAPPTAGAVVEALACAEYSVKMIYRICVYIYTS